MENGDIPDENIKASSINSKSYRERYARLNGDYGPKVWAPDPNDKERWIQADIGYQTNVSGVITQGLVLYSDTVMFVTSFMVSTFLGSINDEELFVEDASGKAKVNISYHMHLDPAVIIL